MKLIDRLKAEFADYWAWVQTRPNARDKILALARQYQSQVTGTGNKQYDALIQEVQGLTSYSNFQGLATGEPPADEAAVGDSFEDSFEGDEPSPVPAPQDTNEDVRDLLANFLTENELPSSLMGFITSALAQKWSYGRIVAELRQTSEYKAAYPENELRRQKGFDAWSEAEIRQFRSEARRLAHEYVGVDDLSNAEISQMIGKNWSLREWERKLQDYQDFERWGPTVKAVLEGELGYSLSDDRVFALLSGDTPTPELDRAYEMALRRGQPAALGLGIRPEDEAEMLRQFGISPEQAFKGYQGIVEEMPRAERLAIIDRFIAGNQDQFPSAATLLGDTSFQDLFKAIQFGDPETILKLQGQIARELARHQGGGGIASSSSGAAIGLLTPDERR